VDAPTSAVPNRLLRDGALPALDASDVLDALAMAAGPAARPRPEPEAPSPAAAALLAVLARGPATRDELARAVRQPPGAIAGAVLDLELEGRIALDRDGRLRIVA
jgi:predicted Rossmann fold nucleotide-binding protein DprA/Smf involved in DNA uptake